MSLLNISEPHDTENFNNNSCAVGIDFGTTYSLIAISIDKKAKIIPSIDSSEMIPSTVSFDQDITISSIKRLFGKSKKEIERSTILSHIVQGKLDQNSSRVRLNINNNLLSPAEIAAIILKKLKQNAENYLGEQVKEAVITVPAYFDDAAKGEMLFAAKLADLKVLRLLTEPTAAAYAYGINKKAIGTYIVYDLGGGTFDVSLLNIEQGIVQVIALGGDNLLGGDDIDLLLKNFFVQQYNLFDYDDELLAIAKAAKETLSSCEEFIHHIALRNTTIQIDKTIFEQLIFSLIERTIKITKDVLLEADDKTIEGIILVGGSSRIPLITKLLKESFNIKILSDIDVDKIVALGAALQAENLTKNNNTLLIDAMPLSLGLELYGGLVEKIIPRNSPLPISITKEYTTYVDNQHAIEFHIVQGEREFAKDCRSLGSFVLADLASSKAGGIKVEVTFAVDMDGVLSVSAFDITSNKFYNVQFNPSYGLSKQEIDQILDNAYKNAAIDHQNMILQGKIIQVKSFITNLHNILRIMQDKLEPEQKHIMMDLVKSVEKSVNARNFTLINKDFEKLKRTVDKVVGRKLPSIVAQKLKGQNINEIYR